MSNRKFGNHTLAFITVALILIGAVSYTIYKKFAADKTEDGVGIVSDNNSAPLNNLSQEGNPQKEQDYEATTQNNSNITGRVVSVNTNAEKKTFIKVKSFTDQNNYTLLTSLDSDLVDIELGDIISFSGSLEKSNNNAYYFVNKVTDYNIVEKSTNIDTSTNKVNVADIKPNMEGHGVILNGLVSDLTTSKKGHSFFTIMDEGYSINGVLFKSETNQLEDRLALLNQHNNTLNGVNLEGKVNIYKGELQVIVSKVYN